ncbi:hypothetical protein [Endozoicomonas sp.]|uniref:hypothetical protein n=1 Tax=Endozoicomonas sp. TaxID=1892382 RepID=UPI003AF9D88C
MLTTSLPTAPLPQSPTVSTGSEKTGEDCKTSTLTKPSELTPFQKCILASQSFILNSVQLYRVMNDVFGKTQPEALQWIPEDFYALPELEKSERLTDIVKQLDVGFHKSPIHREEQGKIVERWEASEQITAIGNLSETSRGQLRSALESLKLSEVEPLEFTEQTTLIFPGAAIPRMHLRPEFAITQNSDNKSPAHLICTGSSRPLKDIDQLQNPENNQKLHKRISELVEQFKSDLEHSATEAHAQMALMDMLRTDNPDCFLNKQTVYVTYTGDIHYYKQSLQENGEYTLDRDNICEGRPNTEATMVSVLNALEQLPVSNFGDIVIVSNKPHTPAQKLATQRAVANRSENCCCNPITIRACGDQASLESPKDLFLAIDSVRKSTQLLNPNYHVTTNWAGDPECKLFKSEHPGEWELVKPEPVPSPERLI